ncbi:MAG: ABC transporter ATP-binding protein [Anaerolineales bacterium]|nr:MAG: ABC transporter ATP-binding protein [Anaerolineales bacterium]
MKIRETIVVEARGLLKKYPGVTAVNNVSFEVHEGEIFGMVGPNGAGKTTAIECIEGLRKPDRGSIRVLGLDPQQDGYELRERIGIQFQSAALPPRIKVGEALDLFASFYRKSVEWRQLLEQVGLESKDGAYVDKLSGGQRQRVFIAMALLNDPELVFLDELTTGLDPQSRRAVWDLIEDIRKRGRTVFLSTHFMEEAERLCDRVAIVDHGKIVALDTPGSLIASLRAENRVVFNVVEPFDEESLRRIPSVSRVERIGERVIVYGQREGLVSGVVNALDSGATRFNDLRTEQPTLEDVFLALTGKKMRN